MMYSCLIGETSIWPCQREVDEFLASGGTIAELEVPVVDVDELTVEADTAGTAVADVDATPLVEDVPTTEQGGKFS